MIATATVERGKAVGKGAGESAAEQRARLRSCIVPGGELRRHASSVAVHGIVPTILATMSDWFSGSHAMTKSGLSPPHATPFQRQW